VTHPTPSAMLAMAERLRESASEEDVTEAADMLRDAALAQPDPLTIAAHDAGITFAIAQLAEILGVKDWHIQDGSEDHDRDVYNTINHVLNLADIRGEGRDAPGSASACKAALSQTGPSNPNEGPKEEEA